MNLLLLTENDFIDEHHVHLNDRRAEHICNILKTQSGEQINAGILHYGIGRAKIVALEKNTVRKNCSVHLKIDKATFKQPPPAALDIQLVLALPRPNMLRRTLRHATELGIKSIHLFQADKVEKSFWQTPLLTPEHIQETLLLGLEQCGDTHLPTVNTHKHPKKFIEHTLAEISSTRCKFLAHPYATQACPSNFNQACSLLIGPEGGFSNTEIATFEHLGFQPVHIGQRILRVENAVTALISRLAPWAP